MRIPRAPLLVVLAACAGPGAGIRLPAEGALGPYSGSVASGDLVFASGKVRRDRADFAAEAGSAIDEVARELARHGVGLGDVVSVTEPYPARTCVAAVALPGGAHVEITAIARRR